ncbi:MAG: DMT family transporter [Boseongicola sp.]|nr:DMT family transporter [Boseongicola sp.]
MVLTGVLFVGMTAAVKQGAADLPAAVSAFLRFALGLVFLAPMTGTLLRTRISPRQWRLVGLRGAVHTLGVCLWFHAMTRITLAEVTAMNNLVPVYVTLGAVLFLGETLAVRRLVAVGIAFFGALLILRPGLRELSDGHLAMIFVAMCLAGSYLFAKRMTAELPASVIVAMMSIVVTILLLPLAIAVWRWPTPIEVAWIMLIACLATCGHYTMTRSFAAAPLSVTQPVAFLPLVWSVLIGFFVFHEAIDIWVILGGSLIIAAATFIAIRESFLNRDRRVNDGSGPL